MYNLARGHALLTGRNYIALEDLPIVVKTVLSTAMIERVGLLFLLISQGGKALTDDIMRGLNVTRHTALRTMTELSVIGLVEIYEDKGDHDTQFTKHIGLKDKFDWFLQLLNSINYVIVSSRFSNRDFMGDKRRKPRTNAEKTTPYSHDYNFSERSV